MGELINNRGFQYGDAVFETLKVIDQKILFFEDHYFRLMAAMRMMRMEIPLSFTMEFIAQEIQQAIAAFASKSNAYRIRFSVYRKDGGLYQPETNDVDYLIAVKSLASAIYLLDEKPYEIELFKDHYVSPQILSTLKTNNRLINVIGSVFAKENGYQNCLLINSDKSIVEALNGNVFIVKDQKIRTPKLEDGCIKGIMRMQVLDILKKIPDYEITEATISPFELQKADEIFITNCITGIQSVTKYRKKTYCNSVARQLIGKLNAKIRLS